MTKPSHKGGRNTGLVGKEKNWNNNNDVDGGWRVVLLRALVAGQLDIVSRELNEHVDVLSLPFTSVMPVWMLQSESLHWWMLGEATPLFIASVYAHPLIVQWLLEHGADRTSRYYLGRTPIDLVGECCEASVDVRVTRIQSIQPPKNYGMNNEVSTRSMPTVTSLAERIAMCYRLLTDHPSLPAPPTEQVQYICHMETQVVVKPTSIALSTESESIRQQQTLYKCLAVAEITWVTPPSNGAIIEKYEVRHRRLPSGDNVGEDNGGDINDDGTVVDQDEWTGEQSLSEASNSVGSWRVERVNHNRNTQKQGIVVGGLELNSRYEFTIRSWNAVGKGEWGVPHKVTTPSGK